MVCSMPLPGRQFTPRRAPRETLALAVWCGLAAGLLEVLTKVVCTAMGRSGRLYQMSRHFFWLIPLTNILVFLVLGMFLALFVWMFPRLGRWFSPRWLGALAILPSFLVAGPEIHSVAWFVLAWGLAVRSVPLLERHGSGFRRVVAFSFPVLIGIELALAGLVFGREWVKQFRESAHALPSPCSLYVGL